MTVCRRLETPDDTERAGAALWHALQVPLVVHLEGDLGAGKTSLVRGLLRAAGHTGPVPSPTYTLVEPYATDPLVHHLDLYRLADPEELEYIGLRDLLAEGGAVLVEWPERGAGVLPAADLTLALSVDGTGRELTLDATTEQGRGVLRTWAAEFDVRSKK